MSERTYSDDDEPGSSPGGYPPVNPSLVPPESAATRDRYTFGRELGRGGMGRVVEAVDRQFDRTVAVKLLLGRSAQARARFDAEARVTGQLEHPAIPSVHARGELDDGTPFYAMHLAHGRTLAEALDAAHTLAERLRYLPVLVQVAQALGFAHERGVIHRDIKPQNIVVGSHGRAFLLDWGIARTSRGIGTSPGSGESPAADAHYTLQGSVMGTPAYMAPEQARGDVAEMDSRTDVFALGAILYHLLSGDCPYAGDTAAVALAAAVDARYKPLPTDVPEGLRAICARAMAREPADRYGDALEMADALEHFLSSAVLAKPDGRVEGFALAANVATGLLLLVFSGGVWATIPDLHQQGAVAFGYVTMGGISAAMAAVEWRTQGRFLLDTLILAFAGITLLFGLAGIGLDLVSTLAGVLAVQAQDPAAVPAQLLEGTWESLACLPASATMAALQLLAWGVLRRRREMREGRK